jgi:polysaccharide export outer membrane protein
VELVRLNSDGTISQRTLPIDLAAGINEQTNPILRNNDIVVVNQSGIVRFNNNFNNALNFADSTNRLLTVLGFLGILQYLRIP